MSEKESAEGERKDASPSKEELAARGSAYWSRRAAVDGMVGLAAGFALAWFITPMDAAVIENMSGVRTTMQSLKSSALEIATRPHRYIVRPEYRIVAVCLFFLACFDD
jgi:hypothetical protein